MCGLVCCADARICWQVMRIDLETAKDSGADRDALRRAILEKEELRRQVRSSMRVLSPCSSGCRQWLSFFYPTIRTDSWRCMPTGCLVG